ncbi:hypothetical protein ACI3PL_27970, partial [Lacticaseibacillus paracasei]
MHLRAKLVTLYPAVPQYRAALASSHSGCGHILCTRLNRRVEAEPHFVRAFELMDRLRVEHPEVQEYSVSYALLCV